MDYQGSPLGASAEARVCKDDSNEEIKMRTWYVGAKNEPPASYGSRPSPVAARH